MGLCSTPAAHTHSSAGVKQTTHPTSDLGTLWGTTASPYSLPYSQLKASISNPCSDMFHVSAVTWSAGGDKKCHLFSIVYLSLRKILGFLRFVWFFLFCITLHSPRAPTISGGFTKDAGEISTGLLPPLPALPSLPYLRLCVCTSQCSKGYVAKNNGMCLTDRVVQGSGKGSAVGRNSCCTQNHGACCLLVAFP